MSRGGGPTLATIATWAGITVLGGVPLYLAHALAGQLYWGLIALVWAVALLVYMLHRPPRR